MTPVEPRSPSEADRAAIWHGEHDEGPRASRTVRRAGAVLPLLFGTAALVLSVQLGVGGPRDPGAGLWPMVTSLAIIICALILLVKERDESDYEKYTRGAFQNLLGVLSLVLFVILLQNAGIETATLVLSAFWLKYLGNESWRTTVVLSLGITAVAYLLFITLLGAPIPRLLVI